MCRFETWSLALSEEQKLMVLEDRDLRRMFVLEMDEVTGQDAT
jgi:hypothetical protein